MFTSGSSLEELDLPAPLKEVYVRNVNCADPIEKLYYSAGYDPICIYCATDVTADSPVLTQRSRSSVKFCALCISVSISLSITLSSLFFSVLYTYVCTCAYCTSLLLYM